MIILDTDMVTLYAYGNEKVGTKVDGLGGPENLAVSVITRMEILRGRFDSMLKATDEGQRKSAMQRFEEAENLLNLVFTVPIDDSAAEKFAKLAKQKKTKKMGRADMLISCIALAQNALLVTRNVKDYKNVQGLRMENWAD